MQRLKKNLGPTATKVKAAAAAKAARAKDRLGNLVHPRGRPAPDEEEASKRVARLDTKFFATPDRAIAADKTYGLIKLELQQGELSEAMAYCASVAIGEQMFSTPASGCSKDPVWSASRNLVLQKGEATMARIAVTSIVKSGRVRSTEKRQLVGFCDVDLARYFQESSQTATADRRPGDAKQIHVDHGSNIAAMHANDEPVSSWHDLSDPSDFSKTVGRVRVKTQSATLHQLERQYWRRALAIGDLDANGLLEFSEFEMLLKSFGSELGATEVANLYKRADKDNSGDVSEQELASILAESHRDGELSKLIKRCPISGAELVPGDDWGNLIYLSLVMDQGSGDTLQDTSGGQSELWMLKMSEWAPQSLGGTMAASGLESKGGEGNFSHIIVYDRGSRRLVEEKISATLVLAMRNMYQSKMGFLAMRAGTFGSLGVMSKEQGRHMDSPESVKNIPEFLKSFSGEVDVSEALEPIESFKTFNQFFYRKLKPSARPIAMAEKADVAVSAADCRLTAFATTSDATRCWIKGRKFSIKGLLADDNKLAASDGAKFAPEFENGSMFIFRLAPQDYHRFHLPVGGTLRSIRHVRGKLLTVNPIAVASTYANVFTQNKRAVVILDSPIFGAVALVCIGATMVGSIVFTAEVGTTYEKGDELGYFAFGGSTIIALFGADALAIDADLLHNSSRSLETLVKMGGRLGCLPSSPDLQTSSVTAMALEKLSLQTRHLAPINEAFDILSGAPSLPGGSPRTLQRQRTAIPIHALQVDDDVTISSSSNSSGPNSESES